MGKHTINKSMLTRSEEIMRRNGSRFVLLLALADDGTVDVVKSLNISEAEFNASVMRFLRQYPDAWQAVWAEMNNK